MEKNSERVLNHAMEIICLLTGEVSLLQHLTKSHIKIKSSKDKKMTEKILNHTMGIIYLLTGEEYAIVKRNPPQSSHHQRIKECEDSAVSLSMEVWEQTGHKEAHNKLEVSSHKSQGLQDENVDTEKEEDEIDEKDILQVTIHSDPCTDLQDEDLSNVSINEDGEYDRDEKDIVQMEIHSDPCTGSVEVKPSVIPKSEQEELDERGHLHVKEEEIPIKIGEDGTINRNSPGQHHCLQRSRDTGETQSYSEAIQVNYKPYKNGSKSIHNLDKVLNSQAEVSLAELQLSTHKEQASQEKSSIYLKTRSSESTHTSENHRNILSMKNNSCEFGENSRHHNPEPPIHQNIHTGVKPFTCFECGKCFRYKSNLAEHERTHTGVKPFECSECGKCFSKKSNLVLHERIHTGVKPFVCMECGKCFRFKSDIIHHESVHTGAKPFACSECGKCFSQKSSLVDHEKIHTGEKPFTCSGCGKAFTQKSNLVQHERIHTGVKPFKCSECGKCFSQKPSLVRHERIHTGVRPFACSECGKSFISNTLCIRHQKSHNNNNNKKQI